MDLHFASLWSLTQNDLIIYMHTNVLQCNRTNALDEFFSIVLDLQKEPKEVALIGAGCSSATLPTAEISHYYNLTQVSEWKYIFIYLYYFGWQVFCYFYILVIFFFEHTTSMYIIIIL